MSTIKSDARAAVPPEYSDSDPRNPNQLTQQSQANLDQITADSTFDDAPKKRAIRETFISQQSGLTNIAAVSILALMALLVMGRMTWRF
jgi:hypothetical protein